MHVSTIGLEANPETLIARAQHVAIINNDPQLAQHLEDVYEDQLSHTTENLTIEQIIDLLVVLGFQVSDWTGRPLLSVWPLAGDPDNQVIVTLLSRITYRSSVQAKLSMSTAAGWVADMERSGLWMMVSAIRVPAPL